MTNLRNCSLLHQFIGTIFALCKENTSRLSQFQQVWSIHHLKINTENSSIFCMSLKYFLAIGYCPAFFYYFLHSCVKSVKVAWFLYRMLQKRCSNWASIESIFQFSRHFIKTISVQFEWENLLDNHLNSIPNNPWFFTMKIEERQTTA